MVKIKPLSDIAAKWADVTPGRASYYEAGVKAPSKDWESNTAAAAKAQAAGSQMAISKGLFAKGVHRVKTEKWQRKSTTLGVSRFPEGVAAGRPDYEAGFGPSHAVIARVSLDARGPRGAAGNYNRSKQIGDALHKARVGGTVAVTTS